jgi:hypothetical protein
MIVISLLTLAACAVTAVLVVRIGNRTLRRQRTENRKRAARRLWEMRERDIHHNLDVLGSLAEMRERGLMQISDQSWRSLIEVNKTHPEYLEELLFHLEAHAYHMRELQHPTPIQVLSAEEVAAYEVKKRRTPDSDHTPKDGLTIVPSMA